MSDHKLYKEVAVITGGGTGIGRAVALALAREGVAVAVNYSRSQDEAEKTVEEIRGNGGLALPVQADVANQSQVEKMFTLVKNELGLATILVNNAGRTHFMDFGDLEAITAEIWDEIHSVNVNGAFFCSRSAARQMRKAGQGCVVNVASIAGLTGRGSSIPYAVSKAAMIGLTKSLAITLAPTIRVNAVAPGVVETRWIHGQDEFKNRSINETPLGRNATPKDVAEVVVSLATSLKFVTGEIVTVDGGRTL